MVDTKTKVKEVKIFFYINATELVNILSLLGLVKFYREFLQLKIIKTIYQLVQQSKNHLIKFFLIF